MKYKIFFTILICSFLIINCEQKIVDPPPSQQNFEIAFSSNRDGDDEIFVMNADGSSQQRLTDNSVKDWFPKWSPDSQKIAYLSSVNGNAQLFVINMDGSNVKEISEKDPNIKPTWSPNNSEILFAAPQGANGNNKIFRVKTNDNTEELLVDLGEISSSPVYSSDGNNVVFAALSDTEQRIDIYIKSLTNGRITRLTNDKGIFPVNNYPDWNPVK